MASSTTKRIETFSDDDLERRLRDIVRERFPDEIFDRRELSHLVRVVTSDVLLLTDLYARVSLRDILDAGGTTVPSFVSHILDPSAPESDALVYEVKRLPDRIKSVGDKCLFDVGLIGQSDYHGVSLQELGQRSYHLASEILERLGEDPRLSRFFRENRMQNLPIEEEVSFLAQCSRRFAMYARILHCLRAADPEHSGPESDEAGPASGETARGAGAEPAAAPSLPEVGMPASDPVAGGGTPDAAALVARFPVHQGDAARERLLLSKEELLSAWERILLFSWLDIDGLVERLQHTVVAQEQAIRALADDFALHAVGTRNLNRPPSYLFVGPTGVGKNYLVETLIAMLEEEWKIEIPFLTLEGPNYTYPSDINELRGATRGFIRSDEEGILTEFHHRAAGAPLSVLLIDEVEKAHPQLRKFFLSIMDRGTVTDNRGQVLSFANSMLVFTSNIGYSDLARHGAPIGYGDVESADRTAGQQVRRDLRRTLSPEFVNRLKMVHFEHLDPSAIDRIFDLEFRRIARRFDEVHGLVTQLEPAARAEILKQGYSHDHGARFLRAVMERCLNVEISRKIKADETRPSRGSRRILRYLRELKGNKRPFDLDAVRQRVLGQARVRVPYARIIVDHRDGEFTYRGVGD
ncbi:MAG: AAA family ATPase [Acidobacteriota bacterium]